VVHSEGFTPIGGQLCVPIDRLEGGLRLGQQGLCHLDPSRADRGDARRRAGSGCQPALRGRVAPRGRRAQCAPEMARNSTAPGRNRSSPANQNPRPRQTRRAESGLSGALQALRAKQVAQDGPSWKPIPKTTWPDATELDLNVRFTAACQRSRRKHPCKRPVRLS